MQDTNQFVFRTDYENAKIVDYRDPDCPNNTVLVTCEHASNELPEEYSWTESDRKYFVNEHWGYDPGAYDMANALAAELKCVFLHSTYSRLLIDPNRSIIADTLFRKNGDGKEVDINKDLTYEEQQKRIQKYYIPYYEALREISLKVNPTYILSVHSFTPLYQGERRPMEIGVLYGDDSVEFANEFHEGMKNKGYISDVNKPYHGNTTMGTVKAMIFAKYPTVRRGITLEFRNDIVSDTKNYANLKNDTLDVIRDTCGLNQV